MADINLLLELRPALDGHAGIPQETRLLFRGLGQLPGVQVEGLLQSSNRLLGKGLPASAKRLQRWKPDRRIDSLSRVVVSLQGRGPAPQSARAASAGQPQAAIAVPGRGLANTFTRAWQVVHAAAASAAMMVGTLLGRAQPLGRFEPAHFEDFLWRTLFAKTLSPADFKLATAASYRIAQVPWSAMHAAGLLTRRFGAALYPRLDTRDYDVMIAETPYPGRVAARTKLVVRYHDAVPLLMPHTIADRAFHQASHYHALRRNVADGAWFACVSDASRSDLIAIFPAAAPRAVTIPNMVSHQYFHEDTTAHRIADILLTRGNRQVEASAADHDQAAPKKPVLPGADDARLDYLLQVSTLEPRKNHLSLLAAWEQLRVTGHPQLKLVLVGMLGWDSEAILHKLLPWVARGMVHVLDDVPAAELRLLYRHANVTVCPSFGEGFGYAGVEAMRCGGVVAASDIAAHREVYGDAAVYFNPYAVAELAAVLDGLLAPAAAARREALVALGKQASARYCAPQVIAQWQVFLDRLARDE